MTTATTATGKFVWHEQVSSDPRRAQAFYGDLFGWETEEFKAGENDYTMISSGGTNHGGYGTAMEGAPPPHWLAHVRIENLDETLEKAKAAGGSIAAGPFDMEEVGRMAIVRDPQGAFISAYQSAQDGPPAEGVFVWDELGTTDADAAQRFYEAVFGWTTTDPGPEYGGYRIFNVGETGVAGLMGLPDGSVPPHWQPYVAVDDVDDTVTRGRELGASVVVDPMDIPQVGRVAVLNDPQGATFGIIKPQPQAS
jgi:uncharacterized protein